MSGKNLLAIVSTLILVGVGCAPKEGIRPSPAPTPSTTTEAVYFLVAVNDTTAYDRAPVPTTFGCGDRLTLQRTAVPRTGRPALETNLNAMFAVRHAEAELLGLYNPLGAQDVRATVTEEDGKVVVDINPYPISAGTCDDPRITEMVKKTAEMTLGSVPEIRIEGSEAKWRCYQDQSGECR